MSLIQAQNITKVYNPDEQNVQALRGVSLSLNKGEFAALAGPSGSGKTTLLNIIGGLDSVSSGSISLSGVDLSSLSEKELSDIRLRRIGFVFQAYNLIPVLTAMENVEFVLLLQGISKEEREERATKILTEVGLKKEMYRRPTEMSGGQQQRVAVARAVVSEPEIILADEPTANLDQATGAALLDMMKEMNRARGVTFLFSTHDQMVMERAERLLHMVDGSITDDNGASR